VGYVGQIKKIFAWAYIIAIYIFMFCQQFFSSCYILIKQTAGCDTPFSFLLIMMNKLNFQTQTVDFVINFHKGERKVGLN